MSRHTSHEKNTPLLMVGSPPTPETTTLPILTTVKSPTKRHHSTTARSKEIKSPHPSRHVNATTTFMPGHLSPTKLVNHEEKQLLQGITQETTKDMLQLLQSPSYLHKKRPEMEAKKLKQRWLDMLETNVRKETNGINRARASTAAHLLLLRTLGKTCQVKVYDELLNRIANFFNGAFTNIIVSALNEKKLANESLKALTIHQERQRNIIIRHINRQQLAKHKKIMNDHIVAWHAETVGKRKAQEKLQKVFGRSSRKVQLQNSFRNWFVASKGWLKARKQAERNLGFLDGRKQAEIRVLECQNDIYRLNSKIAALEKQCKKLCHIDETRVEQLEESKKSVLTLLNLVDTISFDSKEEAEASQHRPLRMRLEYFQELIEMGGIKKVMKSETIGINTDPVTITTGQPVSKKVRPASALYRGGGNGGGGTTKPQLDRLVPRYIHDNIEGGVVLSLKKDGHVTWS
jgi:hypothetical protein